MFRAISSLPVTQVHLFFHLHKTCRPMCSTNLGTEIIYIRCSRPTCKKKELNGAHATSLFWMPSLINMGLAIIVSYYSRPTFITNHFSPWPTLMSLISVQGTMTASSRSHNDHEAHLRVKFSFSIKWNVNDRLIIIDCSWQTLLHIFIPWSSAFVSVYCEYPWRRLPQGKKHVLNPTSITVAPGIRIVSCGRTSRYSCSL